MTGVLKVLVGFFPPAAVRDALPARRISTSVVWSGLGGGRKICPRVGELCPASPCQGCWLAQHTPPPRWDQPRYRGHRQRPPPALPCGCGEGGEAEHPKTSPSWPALHASARFCSRWLAGVSQKSLPRPDPVLPSPRERLVLFQVVQTDSKIRRWVRRLMLRLETEANICS